MFIAQLFPNFSKILGTVAKQRKSIIKQKKAWSKYSCQDMYVHHSVPFNTKKTYDNIHHTPEPNLFMERVTIC